MRKGAKIFTNIGLFFNITVAMITVVSAYSGCINPEYMAISAVVNMSFPIWLIGNCIILVLDLIFKRRFTFIPIAAFILSGGPLLTFFPLNITGSSISNEEKPYIFKVLNYNVLNFKNMQGTYPSDTNPTISYILSTDADIVCLQECEYLQPLQKYHVAKSQIDSLKQRYPYHKVGLSGQSILSKFPFTSINLGIDRSDEYDIAAYLVEANNRILTIYNVHLRSMGFTGEDKKLYRDLTNMENKENLSQIKPQLISKLNKAAQHRSHQAQLLKAHIDKTGGNVIVCGDFNDTPNSYAIRTISGDCLRDAYAENAFGPTITYHANRFYFRIDHVLYKGAFDAIDIKRNDQKYSDHYSLLTTFLWQNN